MSYIHWVARGTGTPKDKIETRLIDEKFASIMGECVIVTVKVHRLYSNFKVIRSPAFLAIVVNLGFLFCEEKVEKKKEEKKIKL
jgi:hypothetical protein